MSRTMRITIGGVAAFCAVSFLAIGWLTGGDSRTGPWPYLAMAFFMANLAVACFVTTSHPVTLRLLGAMIFALYLALSYRSLRSGNYSRSLGLLAFFGLPAGYLAIVGGLPVLGEDGWAFRAKPQAKNVPKKAAAAEPVVGKKPAKKRRKRAGAGRFQVRLRWPGGQVRVFTRPVKETSSPEVPSPVRIVSLLPSLTELICALGHRDKIVGVTHECDYPPGVESLPHLTKSRIPTKATSAEIDKSVAEQGGSLYELDGDLLATLKPDLILTQSQCDVCAVNEGAVRSCASNLPGSPKVESVNPTDWKGVAEMFAMVGELLGDKEAGERLAKGVNEAAEAVRKAREGRPTVAVALLEWFDPPFVAGHWIPELIAMAGGKDVLGRSGAESKRATWEEVAEADPDVILLSPCGFSLERSETELPALQARPEWANLRAVREGRAYLIDGNSYFSRPGPRLRESLLIAACAIDPEGCGALAPQEGWRKIGPDRESPQGG